MLIDSKKLDLYLKLNYNVLFAGRPGVGKTSIIYEAAKRAGLKVKYFSAPTMDPWVDLVGVPKNIMLKMTNGVETEVLDLIPPKDFIINKYDMIFIDEFNRAPPKVTNALMELMQFKSINGRPLDIKMVWAAINPFTEEDEFHVEKLDPAVEDRFQIRIDLPYAIDKDYIKKKHGIVGDVFIEWWKNQPEAVQHKVSPRRIDEAISFYDAGGDLKDMIKHGNTNDLYAKLKSVSEAVAFEKALEENNEAALKKILSRNISKTMEETIKTDKIFDIVFPFLPEEWLSSRVLDYKKDSFVFDSVSNLSKNGNVQAKTILNEICKTNINSNFVLSNFSNIKHAIDTDKIKEIEKYKVEIEKNMNYFLKDESLLSKNINDGKQLKEFIPIVHSPSAFTSAALFNFYTLTKFHSIFDGYSKLKSADEQEIYKDRLAFCIATSLLLNQALNSSGVVYDKLKNSLRNSSSSSYVFLKNRAGKNFHDMETKITNYEQKILKILPIVDTENIIKVFNYMTSTSLRSKISTPFEDVKSVTKKKVKFT